MTIQQPRDHRALNFILVLHARGNHCHHYQRERCLVVCLSFAKPGVVCLVLLQSGTQNSSGVAQWNFYRLAITPSFILASSRIETLRDFLARASGTNAPALPQPFVYARAQFPGVISGIGFLDFGRMDWPALKTRWLEEAQKARMKQSIAGTKQNTLVNTPNWLDQINFAVFPRHLHFMSGASWKDAKGIHFDEWIE